MLRKTAKMIPATTPKQESEDIGLLTGEENLNRHATLAEENVYVGLMFGSKALVQLIANPWVGPLTNKLIFDI